MADLFDMHARVLRRERACRTGPAMFLYERAFADILDRLGTIRRRFSSTLLVGTPDPAWPGMLLPFAGQVTAADPGASFARSAGGLQVQEDSIDLEPGSFDLIVAAGTLDTVNDLPQALLRLRLLLKPDSLLVGFLAGGQTLPRLRQAMRAADLATGAASPHVHPRIEPAALAQLLGNAGLEMPVVDVDRVRASYSRFRALVADLRAMGATNILTARPRAGLTRAALTAAERDFDGQEPGSRTTETFELLHFAAWSPAEPSTGHG
jgi:NADH dehydrogenase [ubiquinone] 1 alpha subcomplex assembly factor 5